MLNCLKGVTVHRDGSILIEDIREADSGEYECMASNSQGSVSAKTKITVKGEDPEDARPENRDHDGWDDWNEDKDYEEIIWDPDRQTFDGDGKDDGVEFDVLDDDPTEYYDEIFTYDECPKACECMSNLADCGQQSKQH